MSYPNWIEIREQASDVPWVGTIRKLSTDQTEWQFDILHPSRLFHANDETVFHERLAVGCNFESGEPGTLLLPHITNFHTWSNFDRKKQVRTTATGAAHGLMTGLQLNDDNIAIFTGIEFESDLFSTWNDLNGFNDGVKLEGGIDDIYVPSVGLFKITRINKVTLNERKIIHSQNYNVEVQFNCKKNNQTDFEFCSDVFSFIWIFTRISPKISNIFVVARQESDRK